MTSQVQWQNILGHSNNRRTDDELSILCHEERVPDGVRAERGFRCLRVAGSLDFSAVGILHALVEPLARARISLLALSTFDTDYLLVRDEDWPAATRALGEAGHALAPSG